MRYVRFPDFAGTPPPATTISLPAGVRALRTATMRDQPPVALAVTSMVGEPKTSVGRVRRGSVRWSFPDCAKADFAVNAVRVVTTFGSPAKRTGWPFQLSGEIATGLPNVTAVLPPTYRSNQRAPSASIAGVSAATPGDGAWPLSPNHSSFGPASAR